MEWFSHVHPSIPFILYLPLIAWGLPYAVSTSGVSALVGTGLFLGGLFIWSLVEYGLHRYIFHWVTQSKHSPRFVYIMHGIHHDFPQDFSRLVMPPIITIPFAILLCPVAYWLFGSVAFYFAAGFGLGYLGYDFTHFCTHRKKGFRGFAFQRRHHLRHHYQDHERSFGVSSPLWDYVFGTMPRSIPSQSNFNSRLAA